MPTREFNFDGIVGPTHNYAGLSYGNVASMKNANAPSNPRAAALEGLAKMRQLLALGVGQAVLPPHERPHIPTLKRLGFTGSDAQIIEKVFKSDPTLLACVSSASPMWSANAATVSASSNTSDQKVHLTPANLVTQFHRSIEAATTTRILRAIFSDPNHFVVHDPLPSTSHFADEGAANHTALCPTLGEVGLELFVDGRDGFNSATQSTKFPARQTRHANIALARSHGLSNDRTIFIQQNPLAIDGGAFHNDVVCVGHANVLLLHELAWVDQDRAIESARRWFDEHNQSLHVIEIESDELPLADAVTSYLFNSQIVTTSSGEMVLIAPMEANAAKPQAAISRITGSGSPIARAEFVDVRQSMRNGGGPACLRLRVSMNDDEQRAVHQGIIFDEQLDKKLTTWITKYYREHLAPNDLGDPMLVRESRDALDELTKLLQLGSIYEFQN
ncbi:MAG TPA: N-succinylarginine dihydrolase [Tepidisphaeraceae bacterium]|nr:N-succinylarginine dihydrolase [Tepidisphaeraceae bacterium]